jgi:hypothetical protein
MGSTSPHPGKRRYTASCVHASVSIANLTEKPRAVALTHVTHVTRDVKIGRVTLDTTHAVRFFVYMTIYDFS